VIALAGLPALACAANPNTPQDPNRSAVKKENATRVATPPPQSRPAPGQNVAPRPPAVRTPASFTREMPLSEAIDILRNCTTPPLSLIVLWRDLEAAGIYRDTPIGIDGLPGLRVRQYLDMLVASLSAGADSTIGYAVQHGAITIATTAALPVSKPITRVYDVSDLVAPPSNPYLSMGFGGMGYGSYGGQMGPGGYGGGMMGYGAGMGATFGGYNGAGSLSGALGGVYTSPRARSGVTRR